MNCPRCGNKTYQKNGIVAGKQRYLCKNCKYNYRIKDYYKRYSESEKKMALKCHNEGIAFKKIARIFGMSDTIVIYWVKRQQNKSKKY